MSVTLKNLENAFYFTLDVTTYTGYYISWHENGQKHQECDYVDDKINGHLITWYKNGEKFAECDYDNDEKID